MNSSRWVFYQEAICRLASSMRAALLAAALVISWFQAPVVAQTEQSPQGYMPIPYPDPLPDEDVIDLGFAVALHPRFAGNKRCGDDASDALEQAQRTKPWVLIPHGRVCIEKTTPLLQSTRLTGGIQSGKPKNNAGAILYWIGPSGGTMFEGSRKRCNSQIVVENLVVFGDRLGTAFDMIQPCNASAFRDLVIRGSISTVWKIDNLQDVGVSGDDNASFEAIFCNIFFDGGAQLGWDFNGYVNALFCNIDARKLPSVAKFGRGNSGQSFMVWMGGKWHSIPRKGKESQAFLFEENSRGMPATFIGWDVMNFSCGSSRPETFIRSETSNLNVNLIGVNASKNCHPDGGEGGLRNWIITPDTTIKTEGVGGAQNEQFNYFGMRTMFGPGVTMEHIVNSLR